LPTYATPPNEVTIHSPDAQAILYQILQLKPAERGELVSKMKKMDWEAAMEDYKVQEERLRECEEALKRERS
jgi:hypothetical protein